MVDGIQLGRVFTMFEKDEVRSVETENLAVLYSLKNIRT